MGDMADYCNEQWETEEEFRPDYGAGGMDPIEAFELGGMEPIKVCRCCKKGNLLWGLNLKKWRLFEEDGAVHKCFESTGSINQQPKTKRGKPMQRN